MKVFESFRDPQGKVFLTGDEVWRLVNSSEVPQLIEFLDLPLAKQWQNEKIIQTTHVEQDEIKSFIQKYKEAASIDFDFGLFKHPRIDFPSFPYEWAPEMLYDAGNFTLEIAEDFFMKTGWSIKDATPFNILYQGIDPVFVDINSFEKRNEKDPIWLPYNQFIQTFLLPLLVNRETGMPLQTIFLTNRDGLSTLEAEKFFGKIKKYKPEIFSLVTLPNFLSGSAESKTRLYKPKRLDSSEEAQFVLQRSLRRLRKQLQKVSPVIHRKSNWTEYTKFNLETIPEYMHAKESFVNKAISEQKPEKVLDVGCNNGFFSLLAARAGAHVVAVDHDAAVIGKVFQSAQEEHLNVLPLVVNLSRPTPRIGWRYTENPSFLDRAIGHFDLVMMLAVIHHMLVQERIPLHEILKLAADLTKDTLIIEFVPPTDKMFQRLIRGRENLYQNLTTNEFIQTAEKFFHIIRSQSLPQTDRQIFLMRKK